MSDQEENHQVDKNNSNNNIQDPNLEDQDQLQNDDDNDYVVDNKQQNNEKLQQAKNLDNNEEEQKQGKKENELKNSENKNKLTQQFNNDQDDHEHNHEETQQLTSRKNQKEKKQFERIPQSQNINLDDSKEQKNFQLEGFDGIEQDQNQQKLNNSSLSGQLNESVISQQNKQYNFSSNDPNKKIVDYILNDFQEITIVKRPELSKFVKEYNDDDYMESGVIFKKSNVRNLVGETIIKAKKEPKHTGGIIQFFTNSCTRYLYFDKHQMFSLQHVKKHDYRIKSIQQLDSLFKIYVERNTKNVTLAFINREKNALQPPKHKKYTINDLENFLLSLKQELTTLGCDLSFKKH